MIFATKLIHAGQAPDPSTGAIMTLFYQTSKHVQKAPATHKGYKYARSQNPAWKALEDCLAASENAEHGLSFGVVATDAFMKLFSPVDEVIASELNSSREVISRLLKKLTERGLVKMQRDFIEIVDLQKVI